MEARSPVTSGVSLIIKETCADFTPNAPCGRDIIDKLAIEVQLQKSKCWFNIRRRAFRYLKIEIFLNPKPVTIKKICLHQSTYPVLNKGWFNSSDPLLNEIWRVGRYTLQVNMHQEYESCPRNEMLFFTGDGRIDGLIDYYAFGDGHLMKSSLSMQYPPDAMGYVSDSNQEVSLWEYPAWRIICLYEYFLYKNDPEFIKQNYPLVCKIMDWYKEKMGPHCLIYQRPVNVPFGINEWTCGKHRLGYKTSLNCLFYKSLRDASVLAQSVGDRKNVKYFRALAEKVKRAINQYLWSEEKGAYSDFLYDYIPQDGNVLAIHFGVADEQKSKKILTLFKKRFWSSYGSPLFDKEMERDGNAFGNKVISPLMCTYEAANHFEYGTAEDALDLIKRCWGTMLKKGARTFWEFTWNDPTSRWPIPAHAWSGGPTYLLPAYVLGIKPIEPGYRKVNIKPHLGNLSLVKGVVPTPFGLIAVKYKRVDSGKWRCIFSIPKGVQYVKMFMPSHEKITINGRTAQSNSSGNGFFI